MRYLSLFSGIEACSVAWGKFGTPVAFSEIEPFPCAVLAHHYPEVPNLGDVSKITEEMVKSLGHIDLVVFGSPCTDLSVAGKRKGLVDDEGNITRSGLFFNAINIVHWARKHNRCRFALWENVPGAFSSSKGGDFTQVVSLMAGLDDLDTPSNGWGTEGIALGDEGLLEWCVLDAQWFGVAQRRRRVFALLDTGDWASRQPILLERESLRGDTPPSRKTRQEAAGATAAGTGSERRVGVADIETFACQGIGAYRSSSPLLKTGMDLGNGCESLITMATGQARAEILRDMCPTLDCTHEQPIATIALAGNTIGRAPKNGGNGYDESGVSYALTKTDVHAVCYGIDEESNVGDNLFAPLLKGGEGGTRQAVCYPIDTQNMTEGHNSGGKGFGEENDPSFTLTKGHSHAVAFEPGIAKREGNPSRFSEELAPCLRKEMGDNQVAVAYRTNAAGAVMPQGDITATITTFTDPTAQFLHSGFQVRRLSPIECARLQGFPDRYLDIQFKGKPAADGHKYKALGNSMAVPVMYWIGKRIKDALVDSLI
jgi:DNA (cytosine-5)-methyltransferase 1